MSGENLRSFAQPEIKVNIYERRARVKCLAWAHRRSNCGEFQQRW